MARDAAKNLSNLLIRSKPAIEGFTLGEDTFKIWSKVPSTALVKVSSTGSIASGFTDYIVECISDPEQAELFKTKYANDLDVDGLSEIISVIVEATTPFDGTKPSA